MGNSDRPRDDHLSSVNSCLGLLYLQELSGNVRLVGDVHKSESHNIYSSYFASVLQKHFHLVHDKVAVLQERGLRRIVISVFEFVANCLDYLKCGITDELR